MRVGRLLNMIHTEANVNGDSVITLIVAMVEIISRWMYLMIQMQRQSQQLIND